MKQEQKIVLFFDGNCGFCVRSLRVLTRFDCYARLHLIDASDDRIVRHEFPELADADFATAMYAFDGRRVFRGFDAFRRAMLVCPKLRWMAALLYLPGVPALGRLAYGVVARTRHRFGCSPKACER